MGMSMRDDGARVACDGCAVLVTSGRTPGSTALRSGALYVALDDCHTDLVYDGCTFDPNALTCAGRGNYTHFQFDLGPDGALRSRLVTLCVWEGGMVCIDVWGVLMCAHVYMASSSTSSVRACGCSHCGEQNMSCSTYSVIQTYAKRSIAGFSATTVSPTTQVTIPYSLRHVSLRSVGVALVRLCTYYV